MKYLGTHHDTGDKLPSVGNAIWLSFYLGQYRGNFEGFLLLCPGEAGSVQKNIYIDRKTYYDQLVAARGVDLIILCVRCLPGELNHFKGFYRGFSQQLVEYVYKLGYSNVKIELFSEPIEIVKADVYIKMLKELREVLDYYREKYNLQILAGAGDLHHKQHRDYYKYLKDHAFHDFDAWSIHCINNPMPEMSWAVYNLGDKPIHISEFTMLDYLLAHGPNANWTVEALNRHLKYANKFPKIKSLFQVFPARISGKYESWSVHNSQYLTRLKEFYNKYIKEEKVSNQRIRIAYDERGDKVKLLQFILREGGYDPKGIDGKFGRDTLKALNDFQRECKLEVKIYCGIEDIAHMYIDFVSATDALNMLFELLTK